MDIIENPVVLCGYNTFNAYGMLRSLGEAGIWPILIINNCAQPFLSKSRYAKSGVYYFDTPSEVPDLIRNNIQSGSVKPIIICCDDPIQSVMDKHYDEFKDDYLLSNCKQTQGEITRLMDKKLQTEIARQCGVTVPKTWKIRKDGEIPEDMVYPCIAKPELSIKGSKSEIKICRNKDQLSQALNGRDYLIQEFIEKDYEAIMWGTSIDEDKYYIPGVARKMRQYPSEQGVTSYGVLESFQHHKTLNEGAIYRYLRDLGYQGMFSIEMAVKEDKYYFLEINLRNDGLQYFATTAGANLPVLYINSLIGKPFVEPKVKTPTYFMGETTDIKQILRKKVSALNWIKDLCRTKSFFILNLKDPIPYLYSFWGKMSTHLHK